MGFAKPVTKLACVATYALTPHYAYGTHSLAVHINGEMYSRTGIAGQCDPLFGILRCVGMRKTVREVTPHLAIVAVKNQ